MTPYDYLKPDGTRGDKRRWPKGTLVTVTLLGGSTVKGATAGVPRMFPAGGWGVRVTGVPYVVALERVTVRYQLGLLEEGPGGASESVKAS